MVFDDSLGGADFHTLADTVFAHDFPSGMRRAAGVDARPDVHFVSRADYLGRAKPQPISEHIHDLAQHLAEQDIGFEETGPDKQKFLEHLHERGYAVANVLHVSGIPRPVIFVMHEDQFRSGDKVFAAITGLDITEPEGATGPHRANRMRNFWLRYRIGMGLHEFNPAMLDDASRDMASYYFFRRTHETFSFYGDQSTGMRLFNGFRLMVLAGGFEALSILAGSLPGGMVAGSQADMLRQFGHVLFNPHPSASDVATAKHDRHELLKGKNAENEAGMRTLVSMFQSSFAKREIPLDRPAVMARPMGHLLGFQLRMAEREVNGDLAATLGALISLRNLDKAISTAQANIPNFRGRDLIHHLQLVFTAGFMESFTKLAGWREAHVQFDAAARSVAAHILKPRARNGHKRRKKNGHTKNGAPKPH